MIYKSITTNHSFGVKKGDQIKVYKTYFRNGEFHFIGIMKSTSVDLPAIFFKPLKTTK